jgi:hypothetical protein
VKRVINPPQSILANFCVALLVLGLIGLGIRSETFNILVLRCLGCVEPINDHANQAYIKAKVQLWHNALARDP